MSRGTSSPSRVLPPRSASASAVLTKFQPRLHSRCSAGMWALYCSRELGVAFTEQLPSQLRSVVHGVYP
ncbi:hypothetical protein D3C72_2198620 [compost metagenome]